MAKQIHDLENACPGVDVTRTGQSMNTAGAVSIAQSEYNNIDEGFQGRLALRPKEAARAMGIGYNSIYELCNRQDFPSLHVGGKIIIPVDGLKRWMAHQTEAKQL